MAPVARVARERRSPLFEFLSRLRREKPLGAVAGAIVLLMLLIGVFADFLAPYGMNDLNLPDRLTPPSEKYLLGADHLGRDVLSRLIFGARTSVIIGLSGAAVSVVVAALIGMTGYVGGKLDLLAQRVVDAWMAFPGLLVLITVMSMLGQGALQVIIVLGILGGIGNSRVARSAVMGIKENLYITAAEAIGSRRFQETALYVTLEPCAMCAGAIVLARIPRILFGACDPKAGACGTLRNVVRDPRLNHACQVVGGVLESECAGLLREFFSGLRSERSAVRRGARVVEGGGLENRCGLHGHRGFESHPLRHPER